MATLGRNITFPIYIDINGVRTSFHNLELKKSAVSSTLMSLSDNITGDVYYKNNALDVSLHEYIIYNDVKYILVNPPTIVKEGLVSDNSDLKGMTKYSFTFYHPMYQLSNLPFSDVAVRYDQTDARYRSAEKSFSWVGHLDDYVDKLNKNLEHTLWRVKLSERVPSEIVNTLSDVLTFDNSTIADALKQAYDTWEVPFIIDSIRQGETYYNQGYRFQVLLGLPSNEIFASAADAQAEPPRPFIFKYGKGVGLKNNSATPRNNKIITRLAGYGSENNIPFGYPQIIWTGDQTWDYTINNDPDNYLSYPIYKGIVGGQWVKLIKHPFTRKHLMPSVYSESVFNKVSPYNSDGTTNPNYDPTIELVDYYDAIATQEYPYPNEIIPNAPSYETHQFEDIKPELGEEYIVDAWPIKNDLTPADSWDDSTDGEGNYTQSYFKVKLPVLSFDIYACAAITEEMQINMRSGACIGCTFTVQVDWEDYKRNFYDHDGNFVPNGGQRDLTKYPRSDQEQIELVLEKDNQTFGVLMPNVYQHPKGESSQGQGDGDQFVILGISLPLSYITNAQERLDASIKSYMLENNVHYFDYPLKFDEKFLYDNTHILEQIRNNTIIRFEFAGVNLELYVKQISIKYNEGVLPQYDITLTDDVDVVLNQLGQAQEDINKLSVILAEMRQNYNRNIWFELAKKLSKTNDDTAQGKITFNKGFQSNDDSEWGQFLQDVSGASVYQDESGWHVEADYVHARRKLIAKELQIEEISHVGGRVLLSAAEMICDHVVEHDTFYRCYFLHKDDSGKKIFNKFKIGDQAIMQSFNEGDTASMPTNRFYWRLVTGVGSETSFDFNNDYNEDYSASQTPSSINEYYYIDLSKTDCASNSDAPRAEDKIVQLGYRFDTDKDRQNAIVLAGAGTGSPYIDEYVGINSYTLEGKCKTRIKPNENFFTGRFDLSLDSTFDGQSLEDLFNNSDIDEIRQQLEAFGFQLDQVDENLTNVISDIDEFTTGNENLLLNTGFTGDYETEEMSEEIGVRDDTEVYSNSLKHWDNEGATVVADINSSSAFSVVLVDGYITQETTKALEWGEWYTVSFRASGAHLTINVGGFERTIELTDTPQRYAFKFQCSYASTSIFAIQYANARVMEIMLSAGKIPNADWVPSPKDNPKAIAYYQDLVYLANAMNSTTSILGGLILTNQIRVGNYRNKEMIQETGGMNGSWINNNSPFLWGGGNMDDAFYTIAKYAENPAYQPTDAELAQMAKFVVTHGGRAILNDIILRGYIYALGGYFKGEVHADSGVFKNVTSPNNGFNITEDGTLECYNAKIKGSIYSPLLVIDDNNYSDYCEETQQGGETFVYLKLVNTGLNVRLAWTAASSVKVTLPVNVGSGTTDFDGATAHILNDLNYAVSVYGFHGTGSAFQLNVGSLGIYYCYKESALYYQWTLIN